MIASVGFFTIKKSMQGVLETGDQFERLQIQMMVSYENGKISARRFARQGEHAINTINLLNEQDLNQLNSAIKRV